MSDYIPDAESEISRHIRDQVADHVRDTSDDPDKSYKTAWRKFTAFVDKKRAENELPNGPKYLTRDNVDLYYSEVIANWGSVTPQYASKSVPALQHFADHVEHIMEPFVVKSHNTKLCLKAQKERHKVFTLDLILKDPNSKLSTNVLAEADNLAVLNEVLLFCHQNWEELGLSWEYLHTDIHAKCIISYFEID